MEILRFGPDDADRLKKYVDVVNAARDVDSPWQHPDTVKGAGGRFRYGWGGEVETPVLALGHGRAGGRFRYGWDGEVETPFLALVDGRPVAVSRFATSDYDNLHLAWVGVQVDPAYRRRGYGTALLEALVEEIRTAGRTSIGIDGWDSESTRGVPRRPGPGPKRPGSQRRQGA